ncbi:MAG: lpdA [Francisellaceae bacterium]|nr:lpdA [Francisellaceae bacterium]
MNNASLIKTEVVVIGSGPGGYTAAFRASDLGKKVLLIEKENMGGVCLNVGCIPSKALLHAAKVIDESAGFSEHGISFAKPDINLDKLRAWKESVVNKLTSGLKGLAKQRKVEFILGDAQFLNSHQLAVKDANGTQIVEFEQAIIAVGSRPVQLPFLPADPRIMDSTNALEIKDIPNRLLIIGGGIIGLEMATVYESLGSKISIVELSPQILPGVDSDIAKPLHKRIEKKYEQILLNTKVTKVEAKSDGLYVTFVDKDNKELSPQCFDKILSSVGRIPNGKLIQAELAGVNVDERGFIKVDKQQRTNISHIFAIGDVAGNPMLAHKAIPEGRIAAEVIAGLKHFFDPKCIPSVAYTDPEVSWVGLTETQAKEQGIDFEKGVFPWMASGRSLSLGRDEGLTKILFCKKTHQVLGTSIVGPNAGDLIAEMTLAIEMGCVAEDLSLTIHPHPTLSETIGLAAEVFEGTITDLYLPKKK